LLANEAIHSAFKIFTDSGPNYGAWLGAYVLMPDHLHLFVSIDDQQIRLSAWMKALKGTLSSELRAKGCASPYWQKGFFDHILRSEESYSEKWKYVRRDPVRARLVASAEDRSYLGEIFALEYRSEK